MHRQRDIKLKGDEPPRLMALLESWEGTPYAAGQSLRGQAADCAGFLLSVLSELLGRSLVYKRNTPTTMVRDLLESIPHEELAGPEVESGDLVLVGTQGGGISHVLLVGGEFLWHCDPYCVTKTSPELPRHLFIKRILRIEGLI